MLDDYTGSVIGDLNSRRGQVQGSEMRGNATVINAMVPLANMFGYLCNFAQKRALARALATFTMEGITHTTFRSPRPYDDEPFPPAGRHASLGMLLSRRLALLALLCATLLSATGCIYGRHDLASDPRSQFPMRRAPIRPDKHAELQFEKEGGLYVVTNPEGEQYELAFFEALHQAGYFVRLNPERRGARRWRITEADAYGFADETGGTWTFRLIAARELTELPPAAVGLLEDTRDDSGFGVRSEADTLHALHAWRKRRS